MSLITPNTPKSPRSSFTLIELLVVISIIGILATVVFVNLQTARAKAYDAQRQATVSAIKKAIALYQDSDSSGKFPACPQGDSATEQAPTNSCFNSLVTTLSSGSNPLINKSSIPDPHPLGDNIGYLYWSDGDIYKLQYYNESKDKAYTEI